MEIELGKATAETVVLNRMTNELTGTTVEKRIQRANTNGFKMVWGKKK